MPRWSLQQLTLPPPDTCTNTVFQPPTPSWGLATWGTCPLTWARHLTLDVAEGRESRLLFGFLLAAGSARGAGHPIQFHAHREGEAGIWGRRGL